MAVFYTIGHSTRSFEEFLSALRSHDVDLVVDVRSLPDSDRHPQYNQDRLAETLEDHGIAYASLEALGGRRTSDLTDSPNAAWNNESFRAYADYALSAEFQAALAELVELGDEHTPAITCAEAVYWRCHRRIVADWLIARGHEVLDIFGPDRANDHELTDFAVVDDDRVIYPTEGELSS
jgi:uncharacterized protein (DUF488 family)